MKEDASCNYYGEDVCLDNTILMPAINLEKVQNDSMFEKILYLQKIECIVKCNSDKQLLKLEEKIKDINKKYSFQYDHFIVKAYDKYPIFKAIKGFLLAILYLSVILSIMLSLYSVLPNRRQE